VPACPRPGVYVPRQTHDCDAAVLVRRHLPGFLARLEESGHGLPEFVKDELAGFGVCGDFEQGFVQTACRTCGDGYLKASELAFAFDGKKVIAGALPGPRAGRVRSE
jgi:hypothetical protein